jgi:hypothetical protein
MARTGAQSLGADSKNPLMRYGQEAKQIDLELGAPPTVSPLRVKQREFVPVTKGFQLQYEHPNGRLYQGDSFAWLESLDDSSVDLVFADPRTTSKKLIGTTLRAKKSTLNGPSNG